MKFRLMEKEVVDDDDNELRRYKYKDMFVCACTRVCIYANQMDDSRFM